MSSVKPERLAQALAGSLAPATWIHGDEPLIVIECADQVRAAARAAGYLDRIVFEVDRQFSNAQWQAEAAAMSLFGDRKLIEIRQSAKPRRDLVEALAQWLPDAPDDVRLLITSQRPDTSLLKGSEFRVLESRGMVVPVYPVSHQELPAWIAARLRAQQQRASPALLALIAERVDGNLLAASQEIRKLGLLFPAGELNVEQASAAVLDVTRFDGGDLVDAALAGDLTRMRRCLDGLAGSGQADVLVIWHLTEAARILLRLALARESGDPAAAASARIRAPLPRVKLIEKASRRIDSTRARQALTEAAQADTIAKGFRPGSSWPLIERIAQRLAGQDPLHRPSDLLAGAQR